MVNVYVKFNHARVKNKTFSRYFKQANMNNDLAATVEWYKCLFTSVGERFGVEGRPSIMSEVDDTKGYYVIFLFVFSK